jgi:hypothetical protein
LEYAVDCNPAGLESFMKFQIDTDFETQFLKVASVPIGFSGNYTVSVTATLKDYRTATSAKQSVKLRVIDPEIYVPSKFNLLVYIQGYLYETPELIVIQVSPEDSISTIIS